MNDGVDVIKQGHFVEFLISAISAGNTKTISMVGEWAKSVDVETISPDKLYRLNSTLHVKATELAEDPEMGPQLSSVRTAQEYLEQVCSTNTREEFSVLMP